MKRILLLLICCLSVAARAQDSTSSSIIREGEITNYLLHGEQTVCHVVHRPGRLVAAFPAENSGLGFFFDAATMLQVESVSALSHDSGQTVLVKTRSSGNLSCHRAVLDSLRTVRNQMHQRDGADAIRSLRQAAAVAGAEIEIDSSPGRLSLSRVSSNGKPYRAELRFPAEVVVEIRPSGFRLLSDQEFELEWRLHVPYPRMPGFEVDQLVHPDLGPLLETDKRARKSLSALHFLSRREKLMAGSWRFLTYFGRDTLLSLALLGPAASESLHRAGIESVLVRLSDEGQVAHEEDIGDWAQVRHLEQGGSSATPVYDYKMVDDDFLLAAVLTRVLDPASMRALLEGKHGPALRSNFELVLRKAEAGLVEIEERWVGDWRDSNEGMGGGRYPGNVNFCLVEAALRALVALEVEPEWAQNLAESWKERRQRFWVHLDEAEVRRRVAAYLQSLPVVERDALGSTQLETGLSLAAFLRGQPVAGLQDGLNFLALSLDAEGRPLAVPNSDIGFLLFFLQPSQKEVSDCLRLLELPYPIGLMTPVGPLTANPAYSPRHWKSLGRNAYHGEVIWSWQSAMLTAGLLRQLDQHPELAPRLKSALQTLREAEKEAGELATSELWSFGYHDGQWRVRAFGQAGDQSESNVFQLWSTTYLGNLLRLHRAGLL